MSVVSRHVNVSWRAPRALTECHRDLDPEVVIALQQRGMIRRTTPPSPSTQTPRPATRTGANAPATATEVLTFTRRLLTFYPAPPADIYVALDNSRLNPELAAFGRNGQKLSRPIQGGDRGRAGLRFAKGTWRLGPSTVQLYVADSSWWSAGDRRVQLEFHGCLGRWAVAAEPVSKR
jgi:hypothetical protein